MLVIPIALLVAAAYSTVTVWYARRIYRQVKADSFKNSRARRSWNDNHRLITFMCAVTGSAWPVLLPLATALLVVGKLFKAINWVITHNQEVPAETQEKIAVLEKELFPEDAKPKRY